MLKEHANELISLREQLSDLYAALALKKPELLDDPIAQNIINENVRITYIRDAKQGNYRK